MTDSPSLTRFYSTDKQTWWRVSVDDQHLHLSDDDMARLADAIYKAREAGEI